MSSAPSHSQRILSLDVFRGLTIVLMILVNSPGNRFPYPILDHAPWHGFTLADAVFPFFLFIVGLTSVISLKKQMSLNNRSALYKSIATRSLILFLLGLFLTNFPYHLDFETVRYYGILQRIAICYLVCSIVYLNTTSQTQILIFLMILIGYWGVMTVLPVPGYGANQLTEEGNWVAYIDRLLFSAKHLYAKIYDPEGAFSTLPSIATTLSGMLTGTLLLTSTSNTNKCYMMSTIGCLFLLLGWSWGLSFPINKSLWTSSYVLWSSGYALIVFSLCFLIIDILGYTSWALPLKIFGMNALFAFSFHVLLLKIQSMLILPMPNGTLQGSRIVITEYVFGHFSSPNAALCYALCFLFLNFLVVAFLYQRKLFFKI